MQETIGNFDKALIRKQFFSGKLPRLLNDMQASGATKEEFLELETYLSSLKEDAEEMERHFRSLLPAPENEREERFLTSMIGDRAFTQEEITKLNEDKDSCEKSIKMAENIMNARGRAFLLKENVPDNEQLLDDCFALIGAEYFLDGEEVRRMQQYKTKVGELILSGHQRKQAEDLAMLTHEYREYMQVVNLKARINDYILTAKKKYGGSFNG